MQQAVISYFGFLVFLSGLGGGRGGGRRRRGGRILCGSRQWDGWNVDCVEVSCELSNRDNRWVESMLKGNKGSNSK